MFNAAFTMAGFGVHVQCSVYYGGFKAPPPRARVK